MFQDPDNDGQVSCLNICKAGTLPFVASLYTLNKEIFSAQEIEDKLNPQNKPSNTDSTRTDFAIAIGIFKEPVFD